MVTCADNGCPEPHGSQHHCGACHETFGGLTTFDKHQIVDVHTGAFTGECIDPRVISLVQDEHSVWQTPQGLARKAADSARLTARNKARTGSGAA